MRAYFGSKLSPNQTRTPEGFLICQNVPIARTGWYEYVASELGLPGEAIVHVYRDPDEVFSPAAMASFEGKPVTNNHPPQGVEPLNAQAFVKGTVANVRRGRGDNDDLLLADLIIYDEQLIREIEQGKREVSAGYECEYTPLEDGGYAQRNIVGNHVAVVDAGRAGDRVRIQDAQHRPREPGSGGITMTNVQQAHDAAVERVVDRALADWYARDRFSIDAKCDEHKNPDGTFKGGFEGAVAYFQCRGYSKEVAEKIAGKIAAEKHGDAAPGGRTKVGDQRMKLPTKKKNRVTDLLAAVGLKHFALDAEPEEIMDAVDAMAEEREEHEGEGDTRAETERENQRTHDDAEDQRDLEEVKKELAELKELIGKLVAGKGEEDDPEKAIDDAIAQLEHPEGAQDDEGTEEESHTIEAQDEEGPVQPEEDRPRSGFTAADSAAKIAFLRSMKPAIAAIKDPADRKRVADAALKAIKGVPAKPSKTYAQIVTGQRRAVGDNRTPVVDLTNLGREIAKKYNPHYKDR